MAEGKTKAVGGFKWVLQAFFTWATFEKHKENIDFQLKDTNVYITAEAVNFLTYAEQHEQHKHAALRLIADINEQENVGFEPHSGCFPLNEHLTTSRFHRGARERRTWKNLPLRPYVISTLFCFLIVNAAEKLAAAVRRMKISRWQRTELLRRLRRGEALRPTPVWALLVRARPREQPEGRGRTRSTLNAGIQRGIWQGYTSGRSIWEGSASAATSWMARCLPLTACHLSQLSSGVRWDHD